MKTNINLKLQYVVVQFALIFVFAAFLTNCSSLKTRLNSEGANEIQKAPVSSPSSQTAVLETDQNVIAEESKPTGASKFRRDSPLRLALVLGPGGAKAYAHIGLLRELQKRKIEPEFVAGLEWGALPAALFSWKGYANDAEWQMMKLNESDWFSRGIIPGSSEAVSIAPLQEELHKIFGKTQAQSFRYKFLCPSWNLDKFQTYMMNKGQASLMLPFCLSYPPLFQPFQRSVASLQDLKALTDHLRAQGANHVLYINVLDGMPALPFTKDLGASISWNQHLGIVNRKQIGVDEVISIPMRDFDFTSFARKKEIVTEGQKRVERGLNIWTNKMGF